MGKEINYLFMKIKSNYKGNVNAEMLTKVQLKRTVPGDTIKTKPQKISTLLRGLEYRKHLSKEQSHRF